MLKQKHSGTHAIFFDIDIKIEDRIFLYKLFDERDKFTFFIDCKPHFQSNIPSTISYGSIFSEFLGIARCILKVEHFLTKA